MDLVRRPLINSLRKDLVYDTEQERWGGEKQLKEALDMDARIAHNYDSNVFRPDEGRPTDASNPSSYLLPYWFARYNGLIEE